MAPGGGAGMFIVGFMEGVNIGGEILWGGLTGIGHGAAMIANAVTLHQIDSLDSYVDDETCTIHPVDGNASGR